MSLKVMEQCFSAERVKVCGDMLKWQQRRLLLEDSQSKLANYAAELEVAA